MLTIPPSLVVPTNAKSSIKSKCGKEKKTKKLYESSNEYFHYIIDTTLDLFHRIKLVAFRIKNTNDGANLRNASWQQNKNLWK